jgi:hypothetical protein
MTERAPCYRHPRHVWIANCADCTAWHLAAQVTRSDDAITAPTPAATAPDPVVSRDRPSEAPEESEAA